jgi:hypothetical protein
MMLMNFSASFRPLFRNTIFKSQSFKVARGFRSRRFGNGDELSPKYGIHANPKPKKEPPPLLSDFDSDQLTKLDWPDDEESIPRSSRHEAHVSNPRATQVYESKANFSNEVASTEKKISRFSKWEKEEGDWTESGSRQGYAESGSNIQNRGNRAKITWKDSDGQQPQVTRRERQRMGLEEGRTTNAGPDDHVYGVSPVVSALKAQRRKCHELLLQENMDFDRKKDSIATNEILSLAEQFSIPIRRVSKHDLNKLTGDRPHQGFVLRATRLDFEGMKVPPPATARR